MKIIKEGIADRNNAMRVICKGCEAELEIVADDIIKEDGIRRYSTKCPCCNSLILLYEGQIPHNMLNKVDFRETN